MIDLIVVRHGESIRNYATKLAHRGDPTLLQAQLDEPSDYEPGWQLTSTGIGQAQRTGAFLRNIIGPKIDAAYVSPYLRTLQTASFLDLRHFFVQDWRLRERRWGEYLSGDYDAAEYLQDIAHAGEPNWRSGFLGGESVTDLVPHMRQFVQDRLISIETGIVVLVTHGGAAKALQLVIEGSEEAAQSAIPNCAIIHFKLTNFHSDGRAVGDIQTILTSAPGDPTVSWQHFG